MSCGSDATAERDVSIFWLIRLCEWLTNWPSSPNIFSSAACAFHCALAPLVKPRRAGLFAGALQW